MAAATAVFSERGYRAASMNHIAAKLGTGKASLYHYVTSREEVLIELYVDVLRENVIAARRIAGDGGTALDALAELIADRRRLHLPQPRTPPRLLRGGGRAAPRQQSRLISVRHEYEQTLLDMVARGEAAGEFTLTTTPQIFVNTVLGAASLDLQVVPAPGPLSPEELGSQMAKILLATLRSP